MDFPEQITDRELIDSLFGRVEMLEGALRVYRALLPAITGVLTPAQQETACQRFAVLISDALTSLDLQRGQTLHNHQKHRANQMTGFRVEWQQVGAALQEHAPGTSM